MWVADQKTMRGDWKITVTARSAEDTEQVIAGAMVTATTGEIEVKGTTNAAGVAVLDVELSGLYTIKVEANGYIDGERSAFVTNSVKYNTKVMVALSPNLERGSVRMILAWNESPEDMDLHTYQVDTQTSRSCHTFWRNRNTCASTGVKLDLDNKKGGNNGVETITLSDVAANNANTYMVWVEDSGRGDATLGESGSQVTITDGINTHIAHMPELGDDTPAGVRYLSLIHI